MKTASNQSNLTTYIIGFTLSILFTLGAYVAVVQRTASATTLIVFIMVLAVLQLVVQVGFFLHLGHEPKPRWNLTTFLFSVMVVLIIGLGSLWIMDNLNYHMTPNEVDQYIMDDEIIHR